MAADYGLFISLNIVRTETLYAGGAVVLLSALLAVIPAALAYKRTLADGLTVKV